MLLSLVLCLALGTRITGVDDHTFSSTGESFSMIVLRTPTPAQKPAMSIRSLLTHNLVRAANSNSANEKKLQADDVSLAYELQAAAIEHPCPRMHDFV
jgi:hypothetical protein